MLQVLLKALFDLSARLGIRRTFENRKIAKFKNPIFRKIKKPYNFFVFWATTTIHTFLKSSDKTVIIRQGQKSDIVTGKAAKFSLYRRTHCTTTYTINSEKSFLLRRPLSFLAIKRSPLLITCMMKSSVAFLFAKSLSNLHNKNICFTPTTSTKPSNSKMTMISFFLFFVFRQMARTHCTWKKMTCKIPLCMMCKKIL